MSQQINTVMDTEQGGPYSHVSAHDKAAVIRGSRDAVQINNTHYRDPASLAVNCVSIIIMFLILLCSAIQTNLSIKLTEDVKRQTENIRHISEMKEQALIIYINQGKIHHDTPPPQRNTNKHLPMFLPPASYNNLE